MLYFFRIIVWISENVPKFYLKVNDNVQNMFEEMEAVVNYTLGTLTTERKIVEMVKMRLI